MSMTFWDTVRGHELADVLCRTLPKLTKKVKKKQHFVVILKTKLKEELEERRDKDGWVVEQIVESVPTDQTVLVVFAEYE